MHSIKYLISLVSGHRGRVHTDTEEVARNAVLSRSLGSATDAGARESHKRVQFMNALLREVFHSLTSSPMYCPPYYLIHRRLISFSSTKSLRRDAHVARSVSQFTAVSYYCAVAFKVVVDSFTSLRMRASVDDFQWGSFSSI